jgi:hypothetical protein
MPGVILFHRGQLLIENPLFNIIVIIHFLHKSYKIFALHRPNKSTTRVEPGVLDPGVVTLVQGEHGNATIMTQQIPAIASVEQTRFRCI